MALLTLSPAATVLEQRADDIAAVAPYESMSDDLTDIASSLILHMDMVNLLQQMCLTASPKAKMERVLRANEDRKSVV